MSNRKSDAALALLCLASENVGAVKGYPAPPAGYKLDGYLTAVDVAFHLGPLELGAATVFYGWLLSTPGELLAVVRGTADRTEWWLDADFMPRPHAPSGGFVEEGFSSIYDTMQLTAPDGEALGPAAKVIADMCSAVTITGHSLGGALGTYLAADSGFLGCRVRARLFASPRPGNGLYGAWAERHVDDLVSYRFEPDVVPEVPAGLGYELLPGTIMLPDDKRVRRSVACYHHISVGYAPQLDPSIPIEADCLVPAGG